MANFTIVTDEKLAYYHQQAKADILKTIVNEADEQFDTLKEIQEWLTDNVETVEALKTGEEFTNVIGEIQGIKESLGDLSGKTTSEITKQQIDLIIKGAELEAINTWFEENYTPADEGTNTPASLPSYDNLIAFLNTNTNDNSQKIVKLVSPKAVSSANVVGYIVTPNSDPNEPSISGISDNELYYNADGNTINAITVITDNGELIYNLDGTIGTNALVSALNLQSKIDESNKTYYSAGALNSLIYNTYSTKAIALQS